MTKTKHVIRIETTINKLKIKQTRLTFVQPKPHPRILNVKYLSQSMIYTLSTYIAI